MTQALLRNNKKQPKDADLRGGFSIGNYEIVGKRNDIIYSLMLLLIDYFNSYHLFIIIHHYNNYNLMNHKNLQSQRYYPLTLSILQLSYLEA